MIRMFLPSLLITVTSVVTFALIAIAIPIYCVYVALRDEQNPLIRQDAIHMLSNWDGICMFAYLFVPFLKLSLFCSIPVSILGIIVYYVIAR